MEFLLLIQKINFKLKNAELMYVPMPLRVFQFFEKLSNT